MGSLIFEMPMDKQGLTIIGSPKIVLSMAIDDGQDAAVFAYLEEIDAATNKTNYITECALRISHRTKLLSERAVRPGSSETVTHSFLKDDVKEWEPGVIEKVELLMEPVAYVVSPFSKLRLVLAGADVDNFYLENIGGLATGWKVEMHASRVVLPVSPHVE